MTDKYLQPALDASGWTEEYLRDLSAVLNGPTSNPTGAYCLGLVDVARLRAGARLPDRAFLERVMLCQTVEHGMDLALEWVTQHAIQS